MSTSQEQSKLLSKYVSGFVLSVALTLGAYVLVQAHVSSSKQLLSKPLLLGTILLFAVAQLIVQLVFFLHLLDEKRPRWRLMSLALAVVVVLIVVIGSIWIMSNLNYRMVDTPQQVNTYLQSQGDL